MGKHPPFGLAIKLLDRDLQPHGKLFEWGPDQDPYEGLEKVREQMDQLRGLGFPPQGDRGKKRR